LKVGDEIQRWTSGGVLIFDDRARHPEWNATGAERAVLLIDFIP
jgi:hypothetical protein